VHGGVVQVINIITRTSHYESFTMMGTGYDEAVHGGVVQWFALYTLEVLLGSPQAGPIARKLRSAGVELAQSDTVIRPVFVDCRCLRIYTVILLLLLSFSVKMTVSPPK
jgi:hypothetical protein